MVSIRHIESADLVPGPGRRPSGDDEVPHALLDAARESILAVGWRRTTLTDVARRAGVSRMTIYRRWPDMQSLLADLLVREWEAVLRTTPLAEDATVTPAVLAEGVVTVVAALREEPLLRRIIDVDPELLLPYLLTRRGRNQDRVLELLAAGVRRGQESGAVRDGDPVLIARSVVLAAHGFVLSAPTMTGDGVEPAALDAELRHLVEGHLAR